MRSNLLVKFKREAKRSGASRLLAIGDFPALAARLLAVSFLLGTGAWAQVNVLTGHNDIARTGQNVNETTLTPANVNPTQFGKLFSQQVNGSIVAQPLYVSQVAIPGNGTHNVVYVATSSGNPNGFLNQFVGDSVYAFDADTNGGNNSSPLWQVSLLTNTTPAGTYTGPYGVVGTPVIDLGTNTMYLASGEVVKATGAYIYRVHALDITTGAEKFGGPYQMQASVPGTGSDSTGGIVKFDPQYLLQRPGLLLLNGILYIGFSSHEDVGPWHGWIFSYNASNLKPIDVFCTTPNGGGGGLWMGGAALAAEVNNPAKPYGRMFVVTGNGSYSLNAPTVNGQPYSNPANSYGMSVLDLDLTGGKMTVEDTFTPFNEAALNAQDGDLGSGGLVLLPTQTLASGKTLKPLVQIGKSGMIYILDRDNNNDGSNNPNTEYSPAGLGSFNANGDQVVQEVQTPLTPGFDWGAGVWGTEAYWNNTIYSGGTNEANVANLNASGNGLRAYSFVNGVLSSTPTSQAAEVSAFPGPTPAVSSNGTSNGIVWAVQTYQWTNQGPGTLLAYDATNLANTLYSSNTYAARDNPGQAVEFVSPTITNGKVYVGAGGQLSVYGLLAGSSGSTPVAATPVISPASEASATPVTVTISDSMPGATIYYTTDGSTPTSNSAVYRGPFSPPVNTTVTAVASVTGYIQSAPASATYSSTLVPSNPAFSLASGSYSGTQELAMTSSFGAVIYYTIDGPAPTSSSAVYTGPIPISTSEFVQAVAINPNGNASSVVSGTYTIDTINFSQGFTLANGPMQFNGSTGLDDFRLQLTNGGYYQAGSAFYKTPVNIQAFTTDFTFQQSNANADGITFTIQNAGPGALGANGQALGYGGIGKSVAIKFDIFNDAGEGSNSTGLYIDGALPTLPSIDLSSTGINLHSGDYISAHLTYDGATLNMTLTDVVTLATWSHSFTLDIPSIVGGNQAYVGFTGGTGGQSSSQKFAFWTFVSGMPTPTYASGFSSVGMYLNGGATLNGTRLRLTDGNPQETRSAFYSNGPVGIQQFTTSFQFQLTNAVGDGFTFTLQGNNPTAVGGGGGGLGFSGMNRSVGIKFDLYNNGGEGQNSTGLFIDGAPPTTPDVDLSSTGINLHSGDIFNVQITYTGLTLTVVITDTATNASATQTYTVDLPAILGSNTAYAGFTASSGGATAIQEILSWTYNPNPVTGPAFPGGFGGSMTQLVSLNGGAAWNGTRLRLTDGNAQETRSAFYYTPVNVEQFTTSFDFQLTNAAADGFTFEIQNNAPTTIGGAGGGLGSSGTNQSVAVKFDLYSNQGEGADSTGMYLDGAAPSTPAIDLSGTGINLHSGDIFNAQLSYNGSILTVVITDTVTGASATQSYSVNIPALVGSNTAYVGFTAATGGYSAIQDILNWSYSSQPVTGPAFFSGFAAAQSQITLNGGAALNGNSIRLTDGNSLEARSAYYSNPVNVQQFTTSFQFHLTAASADGFTFNIQGNGPTAVGGSGGGLGSSGMNNSVAVKFDLYNNAGEGPDSTGLFIDGAPPTLPDVNLATTGVNLHSGHILSAQLTYNGTALTVVITDTVTGSTVTQTYPVNIPAVVGGNTAYVGFTGATGGYTAIQDILSWSYSSVLVN